MLLPPGDAHCSCNGNKFKTNSKTENPTFFTTFQGLITWFLVHNSKKLIA